MKGKTEKTHIMATPGSSNPGHEAFLVHLDTLRAAVTDPGGLATALYSRGLIDRLAYQRANLTTLTMLERSQELLSALDGKIAASEAAFDTFLSLISRNPVMEDMCAVLAESRGISYAGRLWFIALFNFVISFFRYTCSGGRERTKRTTKGGRRDRGAPIADA